MMGHFAEWVAGMGPGIANHLWQSTACVLTAWLVTLALRANQARVRYAVWLAASLKFLIPFSLLIAAGNLLPHPRQAVAPVVYSAMDVVEEPFAQMPQLIAPAVHVPTLRERMKAEMPAALFALWAMGAGIVLVRWARSWRVVRRALRDAEVVREGREWEILRRVESVIPGAKAPIDDEPGMPGLKSRPSSEAKANAKTAAKITVRTKYGDSGASLQNDGGRTTTLVELRLSDERMEPGIFGIGVGTWRPALVWPRELSARLEDGHIEAILSHELAHVRRRDNLTAALHMLVETVFWFHPLVWWMERRMVKEREQACDEAVVYAARSCFGAGGMGEHPLAALPEDKYGDSGASLQNDGGLESGGAIPPKQSLDGAPGDMYAEIYAEALLKTCRFCVESPLACVAGVTGADLKQRVMEIVTGRALVRMSWPKKVLLTVSAVCVVAAPVVLGQAKAAQRLMLAAIEARPRPVQAAKTMVDAALAGSDAGDASQAAPTSAPTSSIPDIGSTAQPFDLDVVSIRPSDPNVRGPIVFGPQPDGFIALNMPLYTMLSLFYGPELQMDVNRIEGGPEWAREAPWVIRAKIAQADVAEWSKVAFDPSPAARSRVRATIQAMLASRFKLKTHFETREGTVYALVVAKSGLKMQESAPDERGEISAHGTRFTFQKAPMSTILTSIAQRVGSPVIDKTGLTGSYDFTLDSIPLRGAPAASADGSTPLDAPPSIFNAVEEQLGLKLVAQKGPVTHLVIDSVERPSVDGAEVQPAASAVAGATNAAAAKPLEFEVASLKPSNPQGGYLTGVQVNADGVTMNATTLTELICVAYGLGYWQLSGIEPWMEKDRFDFQAKPPQGDGIAPYSQRHSNFGLEDERLRQMMQAMLADRFHLRFHRETTTGTVSILEQSGKPLLLVPTKMKWAKRSGEGYSEIGSLVEGRGAYFYNISMPQLAKFLGDYVLHHPVLDKTGLDGAYDFEGRTILTKEDFENGNTMDFLLPAVKEMGLKLTETKGPVDKFVIDGAEPPSPN